MFLQIEHKTIELKNTVAIGFPCDIFSSFFMGIHAKSLNHPHCRRWGSFNMQGISTLFSCVEGGYLVSPERGMEWNGESLKHGIFFTKTWNL